MFQFFLIIAFVGNANSVPTAKFEDSYSPEYVYVTSGIRRVADEQYNERDAQYRFSYDVQDPVTGDTKTHQEHRDGDVVRGSYTLIDPDGMKRTVTYTADAINGFKAVVQREPVADYVPPKKYSYQPTTQYEKLYREQIPFKEISYEPKEQYQLAHYKTATPKYAQTPLKQIFYLQSPQQNYATRYELRPVVQYVPREYYTSNSALQKRPPPYRIY